MEGIDIEFPLFDSVADLLLTLVKLAEENQAYSFAYVETYGGLRIVPGSDKGLANHHESELGALENLGFVVCQGTGSSKYVQVVNNSNQGCFASLSMT